MSSLNYSNLKYYSIIIFDVFMVLAPNIGFIAQILKFRKTKTSEGFSKFLSFILLISNILRIFFWFGKKFQIALLFQSILMIIMQFVLIKECLKFSNLDNKQSNENKFKNVKFGLRQLISNPSDIWDIKSFWNWPYIIDYLFFISFFTMIIGFISHLIGFDNHLYVEILGTTSACLEATIGLPQIVQNYKTKSTESLSDFMIYTWVIGDSIKTFYFLQTQSPLQLILSGLFQITVDIIILGQIIYYRPKNPKKEFDKCEEKVNFSLEDKETDYDEELNQIVAII
jgi:hypothetical protein